jgi:Protein of unknown function (DUF3147)
MIIALSSSGLARSHWYEYAIRFVLGGLVTSGAGLLAKEYGPSFAGLFLAFPAILPASTTLIEKHEREQKENKGLQGLYRGRHAAGADSAGAAMGSIGLIAFACMVWKLLPGHSAWAVIAGATMVWAIVSIGIWWVWKRNLLQRL